MLQWGRTQEANGKMLFKTQFLHAKITSCCVVPQTCVYSQGGSTCKKTPFTCLKYDNEQREISFAGYIFCIVHICTYKCIEFDFFFESFIDQ